jgi:hypothetical protein
MSRIGYGFCCLYCIAATLGWSSTSVAQFRRWGDQVAQDKSLPRGPTAVDSGESDTVAKVNNWTVGLATGLPEGTFLRFGGEIARNLNDSDELPRQEAARATSNDAADQERLFQRFLE